MASFNRCCTVRSRIQVVVIKSSKNTKKKKKEEEVEEVSAFKMDDDDKYRQRYTSVGETGNICHVEV